MRRFISWSSLSVVASVMVMIAVAQAADKPVKIPLDKVPQPIMDAIKGRFPNAKLTAVEKETEDGQVVFDVELTHEGRKYEMDIKEDGTIIEIEKEIASKDVPAAITKAVEAKYPKATIEAVMEVNKVKGKQETPDHYEVNIVTAEKKKMEVIVSLDGSKVTTEKPEVPAK